MKTCTQCGEAKALDAFYKQKGHRPGVPDYVRPKCKDCEKARIYARRLARIDEYREREKMRARALPREFKAKKAREHYAKNAAKIIDRQLARRAARLNTETEIVERAAILERDGHRCRLCNVDLHGAEWHLDHIVPLTLGGTHTWANLQALCRPCNWSKGARLEGQITLPVG